MMLKSNRFSINLPTPFGVLVNILWAYLAYFVCRVAFVLENMSLFENLNFSRGLTLFWGGFVFDSAAVFYTNSLFILLFMAAAFMRSVPAWYNVMLRWIFVAINTFCILVNLADTVFFASRMQRTTMATFQEFKGEDNLIEIAGIETVSHSYFLILAILLAWLLAVLYVKARPRQGAGWLYYTDMGIYVCLLGIIAVWGMRGVFPFGQIDRPISTNHAFKYTDDATETGIVLNTPYTIIRTIGETTQKVPKFYADAAQLDKVYNPVHLPVEGKEQKKKNIVIIILESFSKEYMGKWNSGLDNGTYKGYTPHLDNMIDSCLWFDEMIGNSLFSIDAAPALLASIPRSVRPFVVTPHSMNRINTLATELKTWGYETAFFLGANNESLGINAFSKQAGFERYYGKNEFLADKRFGGLAEFDGTWGIWDEPFLQYFSTVLSELPQPFLATLFTLTSHHPYNIPEKYRKVFPEEGIFEINKCIRYTDLALHNFFETARKQPWFHNTIFVISADHTSKRTTHEEYKNEMGGFRIPILIYDPSGEMPRGRHPGIIQQIDVMPTLLNYMGYDKPYVAFGKDMFNTLPENTWAFNWSYVPTYIKGDYIMVFEGEKPLRFYNYKSDPDGKQNLLGKGLPEEADMIRNIEAIMQSYLERMNSDNITVPQSQ